MLVVVEGLVVVEAAQRVDDLVLEHGGEPRAQRRAAGEHGAAGDHGLEHVVHCVFGEHRVAQLAKREAHQVGAVGDDFGDVHAVLRRVFGRVCRPMCVTLGAPHRAHLAKDHSHITSL